MKPLSIDPTSTQGNETMKFWIIIAALLIVALGVSAALVLALPDIVLTIVGGCVVGAIPPGLAAIWLMRGFADYMSS